MHKVENEREILKLSIPLLNKIYGSFTIDTERIDRPDAAIILEQHETKIGIEITCIDAEDVLQYFNDKKISNEIEIEQLNLLKNNEYSKKPIKKDSIPFTHDYIYKGVIKKEKKYIEYKNSDNYEEIIILISSGYLTLNYKDLENYIKPWTQFLLAEKNFLFDKVIFVCKTTEKSIIVYDKNITNIVKPPRINDNNNFGATVTSGPPLPSGQIINLNEIINNEPLVQKENKKISKAKNKEKRKMQRNSRKANRSK